MTRKITVSTLYRHPIKSLMAETVKTLNLTADGRIEGDRVFAFKNKKQYDDEKIQWRSKHNYLSLVNTPALGGLSAKFEITDGTLSLIKKDAVLASGSIDNQSDRTAISNALAKYLSTLDEDVYSPSKNQSIQLVGDGQQGIFHDTKAGLITMHSVESIQSLGEALGDEHLNETRFRSNIVIDGVEPFEELSWTGRNILIGQTEFEVVKPVVRCLATHVNPTEGIRDLPIMETLIEHFGQEIPQLAIQLKVTEFGRSKIKMGDTLKVL